MKKTARPIKFTPATKDYIWGGKALKEKWGKNSNTEIIAECWELSSFSGAESTDFKTGKILNKIIEEHPEYFAGKATKEYFPILVKLIDAAGDLSIQVHPDDEYAKEHENGSQGKTEMWYIADAKEDACIYYGFSKDVSREEVALSIKNNTVTELLNKVPAQKGDSFFVPAGTVHALLSGVTVIEIQQNSNITYRVYDYDRRDKNGNPRELHIEKALDVLNYSKVDIPEQIKELPFEVGSSKRTLAESKYFVTKEVIIKGKDYIICPENGFATFTVADGEGKLSDGSKVKKGETWLIPNELNVSVSGNLTIVLTTV